MSGIVTHGANGVDALTAFSQGLMIMFMIGALGIGLVTTGMVFAKTWLGYTTFRRLNAMMMVALVALQCVPAMPPLDNWIFQGLFGLPPDLADVSRWTLLASAVMNAGFFIRNCPLVVLFNNLESGKATFATIIRILVTLAFAAILPKAGLTGPKWGLAALTIGVWTETVLTWIAARPYVAALPNKPMAGERAALPVRAATLLVEQFRFTMPLALGGFLLACSPLIVAAFVARSENAADMLAIHYTTLGVANPVAFAALRMQTVAVKFQPEYHGDIRLLAYAIASGLLLGTIPLLFSLPIPGNWYFGTFQNVPARIISTAKLVIGIYSLICVIQAVRARIEGIAAAQKRPRAIMWGQIAYTSSLFVVCATLLPLGCPGWAIALSAIFVAPICVTITVYTALNRAEKQKKAMRDA